MDKELIDRAWRCLPAEFRKEVKETFAQPPENEYEQGYDNALVCCFGIHNLTSDAEGEEMVCCERKWIQQMYADGVGTHYLLNIFGSKCLPDEKEIAENANCIEPKPAEPKYERGDMVIYKRTGKKKVVFGTDKYGRYCVTLPNMQSPMYVDESDLEPFVEPQKSPVIIDCDKCSEQGKCDKLIKPRLPDYDRLHTAAMAMQGLLSNPYWTQKRMDYALGQHGDSESAANRFINDIAEDALDLADALMQQCEKKGGRDEQD